MLPDPQLYNLYVHIIIKLNLKAIQILLRYN